METNAVIEGLNRLMLKPLGFERRGSLFNRRRGEFVDVVDLPVNKAAGTITLEVGVQHDGLYATLWEAPPPRFCNEASCVVHARIDALVEDGPAAWPLDDARTPDLVVKAFEGPALRFLQSHHDLKSLEAELAKLPAESRVPLATVYLAILRDRRGDAAGAQALLAELARGADPDWSLRASGLAARLQARAAAL